LCAGLLSLCIAPSARADLQLAIGTRIEPLRYTSAYFPNATPGGTSANPAPATPPSLYGTDTAPFQSTSLNPYLALFFAQRYGIMASLDIAYAKLDGSTQPPGMAAAMTTDNSYFSFGIAIGFKVYITQPRANRVAPYVYADLFKYFASVSTDNTNITGEQASAQAAMLSPIGATIAVGAEYFLSPSFSLGSEIFGLRVSNVSGGYNAGMPGMETNYGSSYTQVSFYTGITLNFRFQVSASVKASDEERDSEDKNAQRHPASDYSAPPPPPPPPPPTPEAVD
jgi:hypothetical protein